MGRFRYAYTSFSYYGEPIERSIERVARFGYDATEPAGEPDPSDAPRGRPLPPRPGHRGRPTPATPTAAPRCPH